MIVVLQSLSYRNNYTAFQNESFTKFWSKENQDIQDVFDTGHFQIYKHTIKYHTIMNKLYKVYFSKKEHQILEAENIGNLFENIATKEILAVFKMSYLYQLLRPAEFLLKYNEAA